MMETEVQDLKTWLDKGASSRAQVPGSGAATSIVSCFCLSAGLVDRWLNLFFDKIDCLPFLKLWHILQ